MYDNITLRKYFASEQGFDISVLEDPEPRTNPKTGEIWRYEASHKGLNIYVYPDHILITNSLAKYYFGNNIEMLNRELTEKAINRLSNELCIDLHDAEVTRFEFGANFEMSHPVQEYLDRIGECPRMIKGFFGTSVYFQGNAQKQNMQRKLKFYDKVKEAIKKKELPLGYETKKNLLRFEITYLHKVNKQLRTTVTASTLYDETFYLDMVQRYLDTYKSISKHKELKINRNSIKTPRDLLKLAFRIWADGSTITVDGIINIAKSNNVFPSNKRSYYCNAKKLLDQWLSDVKVTKIDARVKEMDKKVEDLCKRQMSI